MAAMRHLFLLFALLLPTPLLAQALDAYEGRAPLPEAGQAQRDKALRDALSQVLIRVSGAAGAAQSGRIEPILVRAGSLLRSIRYETDEAGQNLLVASFNPAAVEGALKQAGLPVWGVFAGQLEEVLLVVSGVDNPRAYAKVMTTLQSLPMVKSLAVTQSAASLLNLYLQVEGGAGRLGGALSINGALKREAAEPGQLRYRLSRN